MKGVYHFETCDAGDPALTGRYDLVTAFECIHDMSDPVAGLTTMRRLAGPYGNVLVMDERTNERFTTAENPIEQLLSGFSVMGCLPAGLADKPSAATLLVHSNLDDLQSSLTVSKDKIQAKGIRSIRSRVTNISEHLGEKIPVEQLKAMLLAAIAEENEKLTEYRPTARDLTAVRRLMYDRYLRRDWNFGSYSKFNVQRSHRFTAGKVKARIGVVGGKMEHLKFYGDFFGYGKLSAFEWRLIGRRRDRGEIKDVLDTIDVNYYFYGIEKEGLLDLLI